MVNEINQINTWNHSNISYFKVKYSNYGETCNDYNKKCLDIFECQSNSCSCKMGTFYDRSKCGKLKITIVMF